MSRPTISEIEISETDKFGTTGTPFLNMVPPIDGARRPQNTFGPKTQENQIGIRPAYFPYKEIVHALQYLYVKLFHQKTRIVRFLGSFLNLFLAGPPFYSSSPGLIIITIYLTVSLSLTGPSSVVGEMFWYSCSNVLVQL